MPVGKASFEAEALVANLAALVDAINRAKPSGAKGTYLRTLTIASTMGPGIRVDIPRRRLCAARLGARRRSSARLDAAAPARPESGIIRHPPAMAEHVNRRIPAKDSLRPRTARSVTVGA